MKFDVSSIIREFNYRYGGDDHKANPSTPQEIHDPFLRTQMQKLSAAIKNEQLHKQYTKCNELLESVMDTMTSDALIRELSNIDQSSDDAAERMTRCAWFERAASLSPSNQQIVNSSGLAMLEISASWQASIIFRLYTALVLMREGHLIDLLRKSEARGGRASSMARKFLTCDYMRIIRNSLAHGSINIHLCGFEFRDDRLSIMATRRFLDRLCIGVMLIQTQSVVSGRDNDTAFEQC